MKYSTTTGKVADARTDCLIVTVRAAYAIARALRVGAFVETASRDFVDKPGRVLLVTLPTSTAIGRLLLVGVGDGAMTPADYRKAIGAIATVLKTAPVRDAVLALGEVPV